MFGMGFMEILLIMIIAILALGPEHLPSTLAKIAKGINSVKKNISDAKEDFDKELHVSEFRDEFNSLKDDVSINLTSK
jgi:sec-independent protein translocase protein TatB